LLDISRLRCLWLLGAPLTRHPCALSFQAQSEELARLSAAQLDRLGGEGGEGAAAAPAGEGEGEARAAEAGVAAGGAGTGASPPSSESAPPARALAGEWDAALPALNAAVVLWQTGRRGAAAALAAPLLRAAEALEPAAALRLCLLLLDAQLDARSPDAAAAAAAYLEKVAAAAATAPPGAAAPGPGAAELGAALHVGRARLHLLCGAPKAAKRELKAAGAPAGGAAAAAACVKAQLELQRGNGRKAGRLLAAAAAAAPPPAVREPALRASLAANGAAVLAAGGRHAAAALAYRHALTAAQEAAETPPGAGAGAVAPPSPEQRAALLYATGAPRPRRAAHREANQTGPVTNFQPARARPPPGAPRVALTMARDQMARANSVRPPRRAAAPAQAGTAPHAPRGATFTDALH
jgi:hypothetical protein